MVYRRGWEMGSREQVPGGRCVCLDGRSRRDLTTLRAFAPDIPGA